MNRPRLIILALIGAVLLVLAASQGAISGAQAAGLVGSLIVLVLAWPMIAQQMATNPSGSLRDILIWGVALAAIALLYTNRHAFGF